MAQPKFTAGVVQFDVLKGDIETNMDRTLVLLEDLADQGTDLAVLPELFSTGFDNERIQELAALTPRTLIRLSAFAKKRQMALAGSLPWRKGKKVFNTLTFIDRDGQVKGAYQKVHLFPLTREDLYYSPGRRAVHLDTDFGRIGLLICYDLRFPELSRTLFVSGATIFLVSAQWPSPRAEHWLALIRARAIENQAFVLASNRTGRDGDLEFPGLSCIVDPDGVILAQAGGEAGALTASVDLARVAAVRKTIPIMSDLRKDIYGS